MDCEFNFLILQPKKMCFMEQKSNNQRGTFNLMCYLKKSKALKNGEIPVYMRIRKPRQKTNNMCNIPILRIPQDILERYKDDKECQLRGQLLPVPTNQKLNANLKDLADL